MLAVGVASAFSPHSSSMLVVCRHKTIVTVTLSALASTGIQ
jgi:hypothetical protein